MKSVYRSTEFKQFNEKRSDKALEKRHESNISGSNKTKSKKHSSRGYRRELYIHRAPEVFSLIENQRETIAFFNNLEHKAFVNHRAIIDLQKVNRITPDAVLYLLSMLAKINKHPKIKISGNAPSDIKCKEIFCDSGFYDYVNSPFRTRHNSNILSVKTANIVDGAIASEVIEFACQKINLIRGVATKAFYTTILECMGNTKEHAYDSKTAKYANWWLMALYDENNCTIKFAILDNGKGIPSTVKTKFLERALKIPDSDLLQSVLAGDFRTATELGYRGKGLPKIKSFKESSLIQDLFVLSNYGFYNADRDEKNEMEQMIPGTLICWSFIKGGC